MRYVRRLASVVLGAAIAVSSMTAAMAQGISRSALVIANTEYNEPIEDLPAARHDGEMIAKLLGDPSQGYAVKPFYNVRGEDFSRHWQEFLNNLKAGVAVFYFSGHGLEIDGDNYLIPSDLPANAPEVKILKAGVSLTRLFREFRVRQQELLQENPDNVVNGIFIIDACRSLLQEKGTKSFADKPTTRPISPPPGLFVMYSASAGQVSHTAEQTAQRSAVSYYTDELVEALVKTQRGRDLQTIARHVRWEVYQRAIADKKSQQKPSYFDELVHPIDITGRRVPVDRSSQAEVKKLTTPKLRNLQSDPKLSREGGDVLWECELCPELIVVPDGGVGRSSNDQFEINVDKPFAIGVSEVTRAQYGAFLVATNKGCPASHVACDPRFADKPVTGVSWAEAQAYVKWLNTQLKLEGDPERGRYGLPSEAQWEYAARGESGDLYVYGNDEGKLCEYGNGADLSLKSVVGTLFRHANPACDDHKSRDVAQVRSYKPNAFGLYDVHGNVWEWVADCWRDTFDPAEPAATQDCAHHVVRGGSWRSGPAALTLEARRGFSTGHTRPTVGFRVMRTLAPAELKPAGE